MASAWLSLGANIGDPPAQLAEAVRRIAAHPEISVAKQSSVLTTKAWGKTDQPDFANATLEIKTSLQPIDLLDVLLGIELEMGRVRDERWGPRLIDIDIISYEREVLRHPRLTVPHPHAHERDFVLRPLRELDKTVVDWIIETARNRN